MHIKSVELSHFKSFGGTTKIPLLPRFTVVSGPNGSGKSNILDALLFALGLSGSRGMRAERLPDLVNQNHSSRRGTSEANVTVVFDIEDIPTEFLTDSDIAEDGADNGEDSGESASSEVGEDSSAEGALNGTGSAGDSPTNVVPLPSSSKEWSVTRRLRVTSQGTYTSNYYINGESCTMGQLHEQLQRFRIYPEGYNVVLQGDVTSIISMNPRERREIIDELAGVAAFDRKIDQAKQKLDAVKEREERFRIVEKELIAQRDRLAQDRLKAEKYQKLKAVLQTKIVWERVLVWRDHQRQAQTLIKQIEKGDADTTRLTAQIAALSTEIQQTAAQLDALNARVKALGEDEHLALQSSLATQEAELRQLQRQEKNLTAASRATVEQIQQVQTAIQTNLKTLERVTEESESLKTGELIRLQQAKDDAQQELEEGREAANAIADASQAWVQEQTELRHQIESLLQTLEPLRAEQVRLQERSSQLQLQIQTQTESLQTLEGDIAAQQTRSSDLDQNRLTEAQEAVQSLAKALAEAEQNLQLQQQTQTRLIQEQRDKQRQLDKLEAQAQALQESQGTQATKLLIQSGMSGICGLVAQLGRVDPRFQLALEVAAGARLGYLVVENDRVAANGIEWLKKQRAGRATFLPLNAIRVPRFNPIPEWKRPDGLIDYAVNLIDCDSDYRDVFAYVFGGTAVFETLTEARRNLGQFRIVTLEGEILETSGAMTGGSLSRRQGSLHFGTVEASESAEAIALRERLQEIDQILGRCNRAIEQATSAIKQHSQALMDARQHHREVQLQVEQCQTQQQQLRQQKGQIQAQHQQYSEELQAAQARLQQLAETVPAEESQLQTKRQVLAELEQSQTHSEWRQTQVKVRALEAQLNERQLALRAAENRLQDLANQHQRLQEKIQQDQHQEEGLRGQQQQQINQLAALASQQAELTEQITQSQAAIAKLDQTLATEKEARNRTERELRERQNSQQQIDWQRQKLQETQQERRQRLDELQGQVETQAAELPDPLPEIPEDLSLEQLHKELKSLQRRLEAMEPVNMLALEEYNRTQTRLEELSQKLSTLEEERTELLLRIENFTTLRFRAFQEAFDAVNKNFQSIFAELSDGDGYLQLDDPQDPFNGGLNLVAHPKGKPVRRLASMSGGEKSLTALSFIFALQRYRPSPFYAFDEVDMFLDGANVERLARMIKHQAQQAQFIVVSLRRPMIESADRTIGVTQARGAYTQVLGIDLQPKRASL
ncbi:MAG: chromosome segregation protein SMC [Leptolyngbyaceae cyanobacterium MO_188.B28]|nr:chromosome segregation protein SMC [Leptolyngbyaceae cyanobacterium MO_188.B28]